MVLVALVLGASRVAFADEAGARAHFRRGVELYDKKQYEAALDAFRNAYAEKPSPGIKQNIALSLKGLGRNVEAAASFDEALDEGQGTLKPETRSAIEHELAELTKVVATVTLKAVSAGERRPVEGVVVSVDGKALEPAALHRPIRLEPGIHVFRARAEGYADPPEKKLSLLAGQPVDATFELTTKGGTLTIRPNVADARVRVDGQEARPGVWTGRVSEGAHTVEVSAPGYQTTTLQVAVPGGAAVEYPVALTAGVDAPPLYEAPPRKPPPREKHFYVVPMLGYGGETLRLAPVLSEPTGGTRRTLSGIAAGLRGGYRLSKWFALELHGEIGRIQDKYALGSREASFFTNESSEIGITHWQATPSMRFTTGGSFRFVLGTGFGLYGRSVDADLEVPQPGTSTTRSVRKEGSGLGASWLVDAGVQFDAGSLFVEGVFFMDMHGVGTTRDDETGVRLFLSSPATRLGLRFGLGIPF